MTPSTVMWVEMITFPMGTSTVGSGVVGPGEACEAQASGRVDGRVRRNSSPKFPVRRARGDPGRYGQGRGRRCRPASGTPEGPDSPVVDSSTGDGRRSAVSRTHLPSEPIGHERPSTRSNLVRTDQANRARAP
jgi:hypothetical protein